MGQMLRKASQITLAVFWLGMSSAQALTDQQFHHIGVKAYIYAYPIVLMDVSKQVATNVSAPVQKGTRFQAPINQFANMSSFPTADFKDVVRPNADTLYSSAWLDLAKEPMILSVPDTEDRYYLMPLLGAWTDVFASPGKRTTGTKAGNFAIVGPNWQGKLPKGVKEIKSPTNMVWILGRTQTNGESDYEFVHHIQAGYKLTPLSAWGKEYTPPSDLPIDRSIDTKIAPVTQVENMDATQFFTRFVTLLKNNPPAAQDKMILAKLKKLGIEPGKDFDMDKLTKEQLQALNTAVKTAQEQIKSRVPMMGEHKNGWAVTFITGRYGTRYLDRAAIDYAGLGANLPQDAIYPTAFVDENENPLNGKNKYVLHFDKNKLPPVNAFWSLSMYDKDSFFVANPINRYAIGDRNQLQFNKDGSLDIYIQHDSPGKDKEANWLPAPEGDFNLTLRLYWPKKEALEGQWNAPGIKLV